MQFFSCKITESVISLMVLRINLWTSIYLNYLNLAWHSCTSSAWFAFCETDEWSSYVKNRFISYPEFLNPAFVNQPFAVYSSCLFEDSQKAPQWRGEGAVRGCRGRAVEQQRARWRDLWCVFVQSFKLKSTAFSELPTAPLNNPRQSSRKFKQVNISTDAPETKQHSNLFCTLSE